jgi:site-specific DNA-methyltransferase (adenine-specific)
MFDAIVTDPPYEIALHGKAWDSTGIAFSHELWSLLYAVLKPGGFIVAFSAMRLYHRMATAADDAGFKLYPFLSWEFDSGLPKPVNVSELFDRDNVPDRPTLGIKAGSGFTDANVEHGAQDRTHTEFKSKMRGISDEARQWDGFYYGVNCFRPVMEPILLGQKPITTDRMIDNIRENGTGALNLGGLRKDGAEWPTTVLRHRKARQDEHQSNHPAVKPVALMADLCRVACPPGGRILDPFAGTGSTGVAALREGFDVTLVERDATMLPIIERRVAPLMEPQSDV